MTYITSKEGQIIWADVKKILIGAGVAGVGATLTYLLEALPQVNFGNYTPLVVASLSILANIVRKYFSNTVYK